MTHKELIASLAETTDPDLREIMMAQYIITLEQQIHSLKMELAKTRTIAATRYGKGKNDRNS